MSAELTPEQSLRVSNFLVSVKGELDKASKKHPPMNSLHEGYAVLFEEVDELWDEVKKQGHARDPQRIRTELRQIAAMAVRMELDCLQAA